MRTQHVLGTVSCLAGFSLFVAGQVAASKVIRSAGGIPNAYDKSPSDRRLKSFDQSHPKCAEWTDWRKLCVRAGPQRRTVCDTDPSHSVAPSEPFCAREIGNVTFEGDDSPVDETPKEHRSRLRFSQLSKSDPAVRLWSTKRPFNGYMTSLPYPGCRVWSYQLGSQGNADRHDLSEKCATDGRAGLASCSEVKLERSDSTPICLEIKRYDPCDPKWNEDDKQVIKSYRPEEQQGIDDINNLTDIILIAKRPEVFPVLGFHCPVTR